MNREVCSQSKQDVDNKKKKKILYIPAGMSISSDSKEKKTCTKTENWCKVKAYTHLKSFKKFAELFIILRLPLRNFPCGRENVCNIFHGLFNLENYFHNEICTLPKCY